MPVCAVPTCVTTHRTTDKTLYKFPKDTNYARIWVRCCMKKDSFNTKSAFICSLHFSDEAYQRDISRDVLGFTSKKSLRRDAVPTRELPSVRMFCNNIIQTRETPDFSLLSDVDPAISPKRFFKKSTEFDFFSCPRKNKSRKKSFQSSIKCSTNAKFGQSSDVSFDLTTENAECLSEENENRMVPSKLELENQNKSD